MINDVILVPILFFSLVFASLLLSFSLKKILSDKIMFYFSNFLFVIWLFSLITLANYFQLLPNLITSYLSSILLFLLHYFLLFQYLFVSSFIFKSKNSVLRYGFVTVYILWSIFFSLPFNAIPIVEGQDQLRQLIYGTISLLPSIIFIYLIIYNFLYKKIIFSKINFLILVSALVFPMISTYKVIDLQLGNFIFSLTLIFISLSLSMYFYTLLLYFDKKQIILKSLKEKIALVATLIVIVPLILRTTYVYIFSRNILTTNTTNQISEENKYHAYNIFTSFNKHIKGVDILSKIDDLNKIDDDNLAKEKVESIFINFLKNNPEITKVIFIDTYGNEKIRIDQNGKKQTIFSTVELTSIQSKLDLKFPISRKDDFTFISEAYSEHGQQIIEFASPVFFGNEIEGLVIMYVDVQEIFSDFVTHDIAHNKYIIDSSGSYLYHYDIKKMLNSSNFKDDYSDVWKSIKQNIQEPLIINSKGSTTIYDYNKIEINYDDLHKVFYIIHEEDTAIALSEINSLGYTLVVTSMIVTFIVFVLVYFLTGNLIKPFIELVTAVKNFDSVDESAFKRSSSQEVEDLSNAFLDIVSELKKSQIEISNQVADQTEQIYEKSEYLEKQRSAMINLIEDIDYQRELNLLQASDLKKFKLAIDSVSELIVITDHKGEVIYVNPAVKTLTGFSIKEAVGSKAGSLWGKVMSKEWYENFWHVISERKEKFVGQITNQKKNGEKFIAQITVQPLVDDIGNIQHYVSVQRDITEQVKIDQMKTDFISLASHQLRTPLSAIKWFLEMILNGDLGKLNLDQIDAMKNINDSNNRMIALVNALLNISRIESGRIIVTPVKTDVIDLIKNTIVSVKKQFDDKQQKISFKADTSLPLVSLDKDLFSQVLINLLVNANKYTNSGGEISVSIQQTEGFIRVNVKDNGVGIPKNEKASVFNRFYRASNVIKKVTDGTGLGLYLAKTIIETFGGNIGFKSKEGEGSSFWFTVPLSGVSKKDGEVSITLTKN